MKNNKFEPSERSTFRYWFAHWCAFQMTAILCNAWKFKYLFHDFEKPWLRLFMSYDKVQAFHRRHSRHHLNKRNVERGMDWEACIIDWECSRFTKLASPNTARNQVDYEVYTHGFQGPKAQYIRGKLYATCDKFGI